MRIILLDEAGEPHLSPDLVYDGIMADLGLAEPGERSNRGGLRAVTPLETAVIICLMTDARVAPEELRDGDLNRGWLGDSFDLDTAAGEAPIGSKLWLLRRSTVNDADAPRLAEIYAIEALQPLVDQGAVSQVTATATPDPARNRMELAVTMLDSTGRAQIERKFRVI